MINPFLPALIFAASVNLSFEAVPQMIPAGDEFRLSVNVSSAGIPTLGTDVVITYDPKMVEVTKFLGGKVYPHYPVTLVDIDNVHGKTRFSGTADLYQTRVAEGLLGWVYFRAKKSGTTEVSFVWKKNGTDESNIVPDTGGLDLLKEKPKGVNLSFLEPSSGTRVWILIKRILSFDYLNF